MLTESQRVERKKHLGASDTAALFGLDPFKTATDVWLTKAFDTTEPEVRSESIEMGNDFEAPMIAWAARELGIELSAEPEDLFAVSKEHPVFSATLDARYLPKSRRRAVEIKVTSRTDEYGEEGTDQVPDRTSIQCQQQCFVHELEGVDVAVLLGRNGLKRALYHVERNETIITTIIQRGEDFWRKYVETKIAPPEPEYGLGSIEIIKRVQRQPQTWAEVPDWIVNEWEGARAARLDAEKVEKIALERMLTPLGDAEGVQLSDGRVLQYFPTVKNILDQTRIKTEYPEIYAVCQKQSVSRTPRIKGA